MAPSQLPFAGPAFWTKSSLIPSDWQRYVDPVEVSELSRMAASVSGTEPRFYSPRLLQLRTDVRDRLFHGPGLLLLRGLDVGAWTEDWSKALLIELGHLLGKPRTQNAQGELVGVVAKAMNSSPAGVSTGDGEAQPHTDRARPPEPPPGLAALLCLQKAAEGGETVLVSGHTAYSVLLRLYPDALDRLCLDFPFARYGGPYPDGKHVDNAPIFLQREGRVHVRYDRSRIDSGAKLTSTELSPEERGALDALDGVLGDEDLRLCFFLQPGDLILLDNTAVLHARRGFRDGRHANAKRRLLRLWVDC